MAMGFQAFGKGGGGGGGHHHGGHHHHGGRGRGGFGPGWGGPWYDGGYDTVVVVSTPTCADGFAWDERHRNRDGTIGACVPVGISTRGIGAARIMRLGDVSASAQVSAFGMTAGVAVTMGAVALAGGAAGALLWRRHRVLGAALGALIGGGAVLGARALAGRYAASQNYTQTPSAPTVQTPTATPPQVSTPPLTQDATVPG